MPLNANSPVSLHILQNLALILLAAIFTPLLTIITILSTLVSPFCHSTRQINRTREWRAKSSPTFKPKTILVTGLGMSKGLTIARCFYRSGHRVIGADFEPYYVPVCGRFSRSLSRFYRVTEPKAGREGAKKYIQDLVNIVREEGVELWVSCSGVASAIEDGEAKEVLEMLTGCKAVQFGVEMIAKLHDKDSFIENSKRLGLNVPNTYPVRSKEDALAVLEKKDGERKGEFEGRRYVMKFTGTDDSIRADMTLLPLLTRRQTRSHIAELKPSPSRPFVLQQFISGAEFCTHSIAIRGQIKAFTACPSSELLMHYHTMDPKSSLFKAFLLYTETYAEKMGEDFTGHFSIDFLVDENVGTRNGMSMEELMRSIFPIECNPRAHTAAVLLAEKSEEVAEAYLSLLNNGDSGSKAKKIVIPGYDTPGYYWIGHDLVTKIFLPVLYLLQGQRGSAELARSWVEFSQHLLFWKEGTYEIWDPFPMWWLYAIYWPGMFWISILERNWWSRCNVSTTKLFRCS
jgi:hypothetical protein